MKSLAPGFLIAMPQLADPHFHRSVVLMIEHSDEGSMGLVLNRAAPLKLVDLGKGQSLLVAPAHAEENVFIGGPVEPFRGFVLHDCAEVAERHQVLPGLFLSVTPPALKSVLLDAGVHLRFCLGYAGWGPRQVERELAQGAWLFTEASAVPVLGGDPNQLWEETVKGMGVDPAMLVMGGGVH
ncbi:MAG: YqgE/AlgH family protein [Myxococcaceae bacterium]|nr:YqgE/AlgH family protein [Myxococcaceae bacterium]